MLFVWFWTSEFIVAIGQLTISLSVVSWYFTKEKKKIGSGTVCWVRVIFALHHATQCSSLTVPCTTYLTFLFTVLLCLNYSYLIDSTLLDLHELIMNLFIVASHFIFHLLYYISFEFCTLHNSKSRCSSHHSTLFQLLSFQLLLFLSMLFLLLLFFSSITITVPFGTNRTN